MPVQTTYPGVYVQEAPSGVHAISGVATSVAAFVGMCPSGPVNVPTRIFSYREYEALFGGAAQVGEMTDQVRQFFMNGGGTAWIVRNAKGVTDGHEIAASSVLLAEDQSEVLALTARSPGSSGQEVRVEVDYDTANPERTFNLTAYRMQLQSDGKLKQIDLEKLGELSMDPASPRNVEQIVNGQSNLLVAKIKSGIAIAGVHISESGLVFNAADGIKDFFGAHMVGTNEMIAVSVAGLAPVPVNLSTMAGANSTAVCNSIQTAINAMLTAGNTVTVTARAVTGGEVLQITSANGPVVISSTLSDDAAAKLRLGLANGGLETDRYARWRPSATGLLTRVHEGSTGATAFRRVHTFANLGGTDITAWDLKSATKHTPAAAVVLPAPFNAAAKLWVDPSVVFTGVIGTFAAVAAALDILVQSINDNSKDIFEAKRLGYRIAVRPLYGTQDSDLSLSLTSTGAYKFEVGPNLAEAGEKPTNVSAYALGNPNVLAVAPAGGMYRKFQVKGDDGTAPDWAAYDYSFDKLERTADIFNLLVLPRAVGQTDLARATIWGGASQFCEKKRAFLIVDPPTDGTTAKPWKSANDAAANAQDFRSGVVADHAAVYWPRIVTNDPKGNKITIDPAGTMAGVYAKTDVKRGIWKAPAGLEATLIGVRGLETLITNDENGVTNPQAINTLRTMSSGATSWGARTMNGYDDAADQDYRYVPVRRTALYIEESLYRGLQFAVFEPNAEPLWGQIRLAAGAFMNGLFRQGAFKGLKASDAYYVACGPSTTTPTDINLGRVNVEIGFAPLKPAEFVVLTIKQMAGQIQI